MATERDVRIQYRKFARIYHQDQHDPSLTRMYAYEGKPTFR